MRPSCLQKMPCSTVSRAKSIKFLVENVLVLLMATGNMVSVMGHSYIKKTAESALTPTQIKLILYFTGFPITK